jgi:hypothetical protein
VKQGITTDFRMGGSRADTELRTNHDLRSASEIQKNFGERIESALVESVAIMRSRSNSIAEIK